MYSMYCKYHKVFISYNDFQPKTQVGYVKVQVAKHLKVQTAKTTQNTISKTHAAKHL